MSLRARLKVIASNTQSIATIQPTSFQKPHSCGSDSPNTATSTSKHKRSSKFIQRQSDVIRDK